MTSYTIAGLLVESNVSMLIQAGYTISLTMDAPLSQQIQEAVTVGSTLNIGVDNVVWSGTVSESVSRTGYGKVEISNASIVKI